MTPAGPATAQGTVQHQAWGRGAASTLRPVFVAQALLQLWHRGTLDASGSGTESGSWSCLLTAGPWGPRAPSLWPVPLWPRPPLLGGGWHRRGLSQQCCCSACHGISDQKWGRGVPSTFLSSKPLFWRVPNWAQEEPLRNRTDVGERGRGQGPGAFLTSKVELSSMAADPRPSAPHAPGVGSHSRPEAAGIQREEARGSWDGPHHEG